MSKEKQILYLRSQGYSQRRIAETLHVSRNTVAKVFNAAVRISLNDLSSMDDESLCLALFPERAALPVQELPDMHICIKNF
ncbi:helix-turn-helix domain-containing protein [Pectinatus frisingensis]|uniref:helix-turn-helix domain-containing protein n=1 Tax=Pectinatus frisingensis TaxID=865 RepID=UPI0018C56EEB|nr:helix-turn-helix domain-containing protein [Pectinatus frisingensis]